MITNENVGSSISNVLVCPPDKRYIVYSVYFCNTSSSVDERIIIYLNQPNESGQSAWAQVLNELVIPAGETFVLGTSRKLSNTVHYYKKGTEQQKIILDAGESIEAMNSGGSGSNIKATANYAVIDVSTTTTVLPLTNPTPTPTSSSGGIDNDVCSCTINDNNAYQYSNVSTFAAGLDFFLVEYNDTASPHPLPGKTIFAIGDCIYYKTTKTFFNKITKIEGPIHYGSRSYRKITLKKALRSNLTIGTLMYRCNSSGHNLTPTRTPTNTPTPSITSTAGGTPTVTPSITSSSAVTPTPSQSLGATPPVTPTGTSAVTPTTTPTLTPTPSNSPPASNCDVHADKVVLAIDNNLGPNKDLTGKHTINDLERTAGRWFAPEGDSFDFGQGDFTIEALIHDPVASHGILNRWYSREHHGVNCFTIFFYPWPNLWIEIAGFGLLQSYTDFSGGGEFHIVIQRAGDTLELYVNGELDNAAILAAGAVWGGGSSCGNPRLTISGFSADSSRQWGSPQDNVDKLKVTKGVARYNSNTIVDGYADYIHRPVTVRSCAPDPEDGKCGVFEHTKTRSLYSVTKNKYTHNTIGSLTSLIANPRIVEEMGSGWELASWADFATFTKDDFINLVKSIGTCESLAAPMTYEEAIATVGSNYEWNLGWILKCGSCSSRYPFFLSFANGTKPRWYYMQADYLNQFMITGAWYGNMPYIVKKKGGVDPLPALTPTPSSSAKDPLKVEYCKPVTAEIFNILAFSPHALQATGTYTFEDGTVSTLTNVRNFAISKNSNHSWINALFQLELISRNETSNLETWRLTFNNWPKQDGTLQPVLSNVPIGYYLSEATKSRSDTNLIFNFWGNGRVSIDFDKEDTCELKPINLCSNASRGKYWYLSHGDPSLAGSFTAMYKLVGLEEPTPSLGGISPHTIVSYVAGQASGQHRMAVYGFNEIMSDNFIKAFLPVHHLSYDEAVARGVVHIAGINPTGIFSGKILSKWYYDFFFIVLDLQVGETIPIPSYEGTGFEGLHSPISGKVVAKFGHLYILEWTLIFHASRQTEFEVLDRQRDYEQDRNWHYLAFEKCTSNVNPGIPPSVALSSTPTPTPSSSSVGGLPQPGGGGGSVKNNPYAISANNAGPWSGNRPGFTCSASTYGNGTYTWNLTGCTGSFPYWQGPLMSLRCTESNNKYQSWTLTVSGWSYCQTPSYTAVAYKFGGETDIGFPIGAGTVTVHFN